MYIIPNIIGRNSNYFDLAKTKVISTSQEMKNQN
jgi:hypothetical protein